MSLPPPETITIAEPWKVIRGPLTPTDIDHLVRKVAARHQLHPTRTREGMHLSAAEHASGPLLFVAWRPHIPAEPDTLTHTVPSDQVEIHLHHRPGAAEVAADLTQALGRAAAAFSPAERDGIRACMPLLERFTPGSGHLADWAVIVRDHYVENTLGFISALTDAGIPARWVYALDKGDTTLRAHRIHATLEQMGCISGVLDNTAINAPRTRADDLVAARRELDAFIDAAHTDGRKVMVIDDGGLIAQGYGRNDAAHRVDAAVELTVSGLKRIKAAGVDIPVFNLARSALKLRLGYAEIADSCLRRMRELLPAVKLIGRPVLVLGHGALGSRLARALADLGCVVHVVDPDPLALIEAAEAGHPTHPTLTDALSQVAPVVIAGTTGEQAVAEQALPLLPDGVYLAPFATADFSLLAGPNEHIRQATEVPGIGRRYQLATGRRVTVLGNGRSLNLYRADAIPTQGYDAYRAGTLLAADALAHRHADLAPGVHTEAVDDLIAASGLYQAYYDTHLAAPAPAAPPMPSSTTPAVNPVQGERVCVVGHGKIGRLHTELLAGLGAEPIIIDPKHQDLPVEYTSFPHGVEQLPEQVHSTIGMWSVCTPTADHLPVLRTILEHDPHARVLVEKPACLGHEITDFRALLRAHPEARVVVTDQYRHARALTVLRELMERYEPDAVPDHVAVTFVKDRSGDVALGRFVDRSYGVLGYEWLHMLTVLRGVLDEETAATYLATAPQDTDLLATYHPDLFVSSLTERTRLALTTGVLHLDLTSSIATPTLPLGRTTLAPLGQDAAAVGRHRTATVHAGQTRFSITFDPVTLPDGTMLGRNRHLVSVERDGAVLHEEVVEDSPLHTAVSRAVDDLLGLADLPAPDLAGLCRIAAIAEVLHTHRPAMTGPARDTA